MLLRRCWRLEGPRCRVSVLCRSTGWGTVRLAATAACCQDVKNQNLAELCEQCPVPKPNTGVS